MDDLAMFIAKIDPERTNLLVRLWWAWGILALVAGIGLLFLLGASRSFRKRALRRDLAPEKPRTPPVDPWVEAGRRLKVSDEP